MSINISGPVSVNMTKYNNTSYIFFGDYHSGIKDLCDMPCKNINEIGEYVDPKESENCYEISRLLSEIFTKASQKGEWVDFYLEESPLEQYDVFGKQYEYAKKIGYIHKVYNIFYNCFKKIDCKYDTTRFHYADIRAHDVIIDFDGLFTNLKRKIDISQKKI